MSSQRGVRAQPKALGSKTERISDSILRHGTPVCTSPRLFLPRPWGKPFGSTPGTRSPRARIVGSFLIAAHEAVRIPERLAGAQADRGLEDGARVPALVRFQGQQRLTVAFVDVPGRSSRIVRPVVQVEAQEREADANGLDLCGRGAEPNDGDDDDEHALYQGGHGVRHRRHHGEQDESDDVLAEVEDAVENKLQAQSSVI